MVRRWIAALALAALLPIGQQPVGAQEVVQEAVTTGAEAVALALALVGRPYAWAGVSPAGFDCSGFTRWVYGQLGYDLPRDVNGQYRAGAHVAVEELEPGDLVVFRDTYVSGLSHVGIYVGNGEFVHAAEPRVVVSSLWASYWASRFVAGVRLG